MRSVDIDDIGVPMFVLDVGSQGEFRFAAVNVAQVRAVGFEPAGLIGRTVRECLPPSVANNVIKRYHECVRRGSVYEYDEMLDLPGRSSWWRTTLTPIVDPELNRVVRIVGIAIEITERKLVENELAAAAMRDPLTGVGNRRQLEHDAKERMDAALEHGATFGIVLIDLDGFKAVNDTFGHAKGDDVLRHVASLLSLAAREHETVARVGGDEFAMLVSASNELELASTVVSLRRFLDRSMRVTKVEIDLGASVGAALWTRGQTFSDLLKVADLGMYAQKGKRRRSAA